MKDKAPIIVADDHRIIRKGLKPLPSEKEHIHVPAEGQSNQEQSDILCTG